MNNPLFLSLLMAASNQDQDLERQLSEFSFLVENTQKALRTFREGMQTFQSGFSCLSRLTEKKPKPKAETPAPPPAASEPLEFSDEPDEV